MYSYEGGTKIKGRGWSVRDLMKGTSASGEDWACMTEFDAVRRRLIPEPLVQAHLVTSSSLGEVLRGRGRGGIERAVQGLEDVWCDEAQFRSSMEATCLFLRVCDSTPVNCLAIDEAGRVHVQLNQGRVPTGLTEGVKRMVALSSILGLIKVNSPPWTVVLDEPFEGLGAEMVGKLVPSIVDMFPDRQLIFLLSQGEDIAAVKKTGKVNKELEIWG